jgi:hypothetical protein
MTLSHRSVTESLQFSHAIQELKTNSTAFQMHILVHFLEPQGRQFDKNKTILPQNLYINHKWVRYEIVKFMNMMHMAYSWSLFQTSLRSPSLHWREGYR